VRNGGIGIDFGGTRQERSREWRHRLDGAAREPRVAVAVLRSNAAAARATTYDANTRRIDAVIDKSGRKETAPGFAGPRLDHRPSAIPDSIERRSSVPVNANSLLAGFGRPFARQRDIRGPWSAAAVCEFQRREMLLRCLCEQPSDRDGFALQRGELQASLYLLVLFGGLIVIVRDPGFGWDLVRWGGLLGARKEESFARLRGQVQGAKPAPPLAAAKASRGKWGGHNQGEARERGGGSGPTTPCPGPDDGEHPGPVSC
jgi:hypothetical protein